MVKLKHYYSVMLDTGKMKELREDLKLTQEQAAQAAGMSSKQQWYDIESGRKDNVSLETLAKIGRALNVDPAELLLPSKPKGK